MSEMGEYGFVTYDEMVVKLRELFEIHGADYVTVQQGKTGIYWITVESYDDGYGEEASA